MPEFLEEFAVSVASKKEAMKEKVFKGTPNALKDRFKKYFDSMWISIDDPAKLAVNPSEIDVMAVDSSVYTNLFSTGGIFYVTRSLAICKSNEQKRLESDVLFTKAGSLTAREFVATKMEMLEFQVAIDALRNGFKCDTILIDGSLYGRVVHLPIETRIEGERLALLDYFKVYGELLELCRKENILLVGVSKESRSTLYRDYLLSLIFDEELKKTDIEDDVARRLKPLFKEILHREAPGLQKFEVLRKKHGNKLETIGLILYELASSRPDYQLVMNFAQTLGYNQPLLLCPSVEFPRRLRQFQLAPAEFVRKNFPNTIREKGREFVESAAEIIASIPRFPAFISFYILLDKRDSPIRIDLLCWNYSLADLDSSKPVALDLKGLLRILTTGYCGLDCYNLWLKNVDERVRLKKRTVDNIYFPYMEKLFGEKIIRGRGYRRVRFP